MARSAAALAILAGLFFAHAAGAQQFDPPDRRWGRGENLWVPGAFSGVGVVPLTRAYVPDGIDLSDRFPPPGDQGHVGSCASWATGYAARSYYAGAVASGKADPSLTISPASIHNIIVSGQKKCEDPDRVNIEMAMKLLIDRGALSIAEFPAEMMCKGLPPAPASSGFRITGMRRVAKENPVYGSPNYRTGLTRASLDGIRQALVRGDPVVIGIAVADKFQRVRGPVIYDGSVHDTPEEEKSAGGHALTIVGYDERRQAFRVLNSYGDGWGDGGYFWLAYDTLLKDGIYAAVMETSLKPPKPAPARPQELVYLR